MSDNELPKRDGVFIIMLLVDLVILTHFPSSITLLPEMLR